MILKNNEITDIKSTWRCANVLVVTATISLSTLLQSFALAELGNHLCQMFAT